MCKMAVKCRWLHSSDQLKQQELQDVVNKKYQKTQMTKQKLERAEQMLERERQNVAMLSQSAIITESHSEVNVGTGGSSAEMQAITDSNSKPHFKTMHFHSAKKGQSFGALGRPSLFKATAKPAMQDIPEDGQMPAFTPTATKENKNFAVPTVANLQNYSKTGKGGKPFGVRSLARTENHSVKSYMSSLSSMNNFFRITDSSLSGVIPAAVLRKAMEKRQQEANKEGGTEILDVEGVETQNQSMVQQDCMNTSADHQGSAGDTT